MSLGSLGARYYLVRLALSAKEETKDQRFTHLKGNTQGPEVYSFSRQCSYCVPMQVTAGTVNYEGPIIVNATSIGSESTIAGIGRLVASAQAREAPIQRLADSVSGNFCYGVMAASALTFAFWASLGQSPSAGVRSPLVHESHCIPPCKDVLLYNHPYMSAEYARRHIVIANAVQLWKQA